jgi:hypothetical protein
MDYFFCFNSTRHLCAFLFSFTWLLIRRERDPSSGKRDTHGIREKRGTWEGGRERDPLGRKSVATLHGTRAAGLKKCAEPGWRGAGSDPVAP